MLYQIHNKELRRQNLMLFTDDTPSVHLLTIKYSTGYSEKIYGNLTFVHAITFPHSVNIIEWLRWLFIIDKLDRPLTSLQEKYIAELLETGYIKHQVGLPTKILEALMPYWDNFILITFFPFFLIELIVDFIIYLVYRIFLGSPKKRTQKRKR